MPAFANFYSNTILEFSVIKSLRSRLSRLRSTRTGENSSVSLKLPNDSELRSYDLEPSSTALYPQSGKTFGPNEQPNHHSHGGIIRIMEVKEMSKCYDSMV